LQRKAEISKLQGEPDPLIESIRATYAEGKPEEEKLAALGQVTTPHTTDILDICLA
jgi:hypothetical protein